MYLCFFISLVFFHYELVRSISFVRVDGNYFVRFTKYMIYVLTPIPTDELP